MILELRCINLSRAKNNREYVTCYKSFVPHANQPNSLQALETFLKLETIDNIALGNARPCEIRIKDYKSERKNANT